ncbi:hypothetical protein ACHAXA_005458 [Cyclostephanos tholiformis]|uniref:Feruloyl esterase n=1 Tax=Cyclostephanos tholiformis TaxID=382380 RepID=A0ABD3SHJ4_9STRA
MSTLIKCEERRAVEVPDCKEASPDDCHRSFHLFLPSIICGDGGDARGGGVRLVDVDRGDGSTRDDGVSLSSFDASVGTLPLVFGIHCYGCTVASIRIFVEHANSNNMVLVLPEGLHNSFNARHCCGYALENDIDDVGFLELVQSMLSEEYPFVQKRFSYAVGWSNGGEVDDAYGVSTEKDISFITPPLSDIGFMVMHAASLFRSISPISGYINFIDPALKWENASEPGKGIFLHHGSDDPFVRPGGCCNNPAMPKCCCDISADVCVTVMDVARNWALEVNDCELTDSPSSLSMEIRGKRIKCSTTTGSGCKSNTTICLHDASGHFNSPSFNEAFPFAKEND